MRNLIYLSLILFLLFSLAVSFNVFNSIDLVLTHVLQNTLPRSVDLPFSFVSLLGSVEAIGIIWLIVLLFFLSKKYIRPFLALFLLILSQLLELFGKTFIYHPKPPSFFHRGLLRLDLPSFRVETLYSYPSGHMIRTTFILVILYFLTKILVKQRGVRILLFTFYFLLFTLTFISRIYLGEHWASDVIGGALLGFSFGLIPAYFLTHSTR